jgi:hypothetical protein
MSMPTIVGLQRTEAAAVTQAATLALDCVAAYEAASQRCQAPLAREGFSRMRADCNKHANVWQERLRQLGQPAAKPGRVSARLNAFKVQVAACFGDRRVAQAVRNNAADCITGYHRVRVTPRFGQACRLAAAMGTDVESHRAWISSFLCGKILSWAERGLYAE